jgi:hypothetical protein
MFTDMISVSIVGQASSPRSSMTVGEIGNSTDPAISNRKPSKRSTVEAMPPE